MSVLVRMFKKGVALGLFLAACAVGLQQTKPAEAAGSCLFRCNLIYRESGRQCATHSDCTNDCRTQCAAQGWTATGEQVCATRSGRPDDRICAGCSCIPNRVVVSCETGGGGDAACRASCENTCQTGRLRTPLSGSATQVACRISTPAPSCVETQLTTCRSCINNCIAAGAQYGSLNTPTDCFAGCSDQVDGSPCRGIAQAEAIQGLSSAPTGAVSGSRSRIQSGVSASANEAAALAAGECVTRAIAADPANTSLVAASEATLEAPRASWLCKRVCSAQEQAGCVTGGCPGDAGVRCCPPALGIRPTEQCGGRGQTAGESGTAPGGATAPGTDGSAQTSGGGDTPSGASGGGGTASGEEGGSVRSGGTVRADSGGLTRLILPSCTSSGNCQFADLVQVGLNAVRFLFGLAGVLLLVVFVYAGIEYLIAGDASSVKSAEDRIKKALYGLFFMFFGFTLVNFVVGLLIRA